MQSERSESCLTLSKAETGQHFALTDTTATDIVASNCPRSIHVGWVAPVFFFLSGCLFSLLPIVNAVHYAKDNKDYSHWLTIGRLVLNGSPLYGDVRNGEPEYMYPPTAAVLFYGPLSILSPVLFVAVLCTITSLSWGFSLWAAAKLVKGNSHRAKFVASILPGIAVGPYVWDIQLLGQTNLLLLALTLGGFLAVRNRRPFVASWLLGLAVAMKAFPVSALAYLVVRRKWLSLFGSIVCTVALVWFFPGLVRGFERTTAELKQWAVLMLGDQSGETMSGRSSIGFTRRNQSIVSCAHRLLRHVDAGDNPEKPLYVNVIEISPRSAQLIGYGICLSLGVVLLVACRFQFAPTAECEGLEVAMVCTLVPLCSPLAWTYFFCWLLPAWTAILYWLQNPLLPVEVRRTAKWSTWTAILLLVSAISEQFDPTLQACGVTALGSVVLFLTLAYLRFHCPVSRPDF